MKDRRVLRGQLQGLSLSSGGPVNLVVDDGNFNDAWRVTRFVVAYYDPTGTATGNRDSIGVLATHEDALYSKLPPSTSVGWNWDDRRQVAWAGMDFQGDTSVGQTFELIDPQHVVVRDLYLGISASFETSTAVYNYFIELERVTLNDNQAVMAIIQEEAQDVN
jgi:hypothetical protein